MNESETVGLRLLVLDGGDIRCLSQLSILEEFLHQVQWRRKSDEVLLPCNYFHMICATGPAGIIVILLVVFRMSVQEAKDEFVCIWNAVFADDYCKPKERSVKLERMIKDLLRTRNMSSNRKLLHGSGDEACKAFLCTISPGVPTACQKLRTYRSPQRRIDVSIVEAIRATCATPDRFTSVKVDPSRGEGGSAAKPKSNLNSIHDAQEFIAGDGVLQNPTREAIKELYELYGAERRVACVLSLGCGRPSILHLDVLKESQAEGSWMTGALQAERVAEELDTQIGKNQVYYRFSVDRGLESPESISLSNLGLIETHSRVYLQQTNTARDMQNCIRASEVCGYVSTTDLHCASTRAFAATHGLPPLCASFVMRQDVMDSMARCMFDSEEGTRKIMILSGMGGSGKTQLVSKFARTYLSKFQHVIFIDARTTESITNGIISRVRSLGGVCTTLKESMDFLAQIGPGSLGPWFLILDNADDPTLELGQMIPNCEHGFIAITTRNPAVGALKPHGHIKLDVMSKAEALQALLMTIYDSMEQASNEDRVDGLILIKELGFLPVAIVQAGSYIKHQGRCRIKDYLSKLKAHRRKLLSIPAKYQLDVHHHAVYATLDVTLGVLSTQARDLLGMLACFNYAGFPLPLVDRAASRKFLYEPFDLFDRPLEFQETAQFLMEIFDPAGLRDLDVLAELEQFALVTRVTNYSVITLRFHPLVHAWMSDRIAIECRKRYWDAALRLLVCGTAEEDEELYQYLNPQLALLSPTKQNAHYNDLAAIARLRLWGGRRPEVIAMWETLYRELVEVHGTIHLRPCAAKLQLALAYDIMSSLSNLWTASAMIKDVIEIRRQLLPANHYNTLEAISYLLELKAIGSIVPISDEDLFQQIRIVELLREHLEHEASLLRSKEVLAMMHQRRQEWFQAEGLLHEVIQAREQVQGAGHLMALRSKQLLAHLYSEREKYGDSAIGMESASSNVAEEVQKDLVVYRLKIQGPHHPDTLKAQCSLAELYEQIGRDDLAVITWKQIVVGYKSAHPESTEQILDTMKHLAGLFEKLGRRDEAAEQWLEIINDCKVMGRYSTVVQAMRSLTTLLEEMERCDDLVTRWEQVIGEWKVAGDNRRAVQIMESLAKLLDKLERHDDAVTRWEQIVGEWKAARDNRRAIEAMESLAKLLERLKRYDDLVPRWEQIIGEWKAASDNWRAVGAMKSLAKLLERLGRYDDAITRWEQWIGEWKVASDNWRAIEAMESLVRLFERLGRHDDAVTLWEKWIEEWKAMDDNWPIVKAMGALAELLERLGRYNDAVTLCEQIIEERKATDSGWRVFEAIRSLARLLERSGRHDDVVTLWEQWIKERKVTDDNWLTVKAMEALAELLERLGRQK